MSKLLKKFIGASQVDETKILLNNAQTLKGLAIDGVTKIDILEVASDGSVTFPNVPKVVADPSDPNHLVRYSAMLTAIAGLRTQKDAVKLASTVNVPLTGGTGLMIDGVLVNDGDRILLVGQTAATDNGIYVASGTGTAYVLSRAPDANTSAQVQEGMFTWSVEGTANKDAGWLLNTPNPITLGTTALHFIQAPIPSSVIHWAKEKLVLSSTDITNQYVTLANMALPNSIQMVTGGVIQQEGSSDDYTTSVVGGVTRVTFANDLAVGGATPLAAGDTLYFQYNY